MITLQELFDNLAYGELSNLSLGNSQLGTIAEVDYPKMVSHVNLGLLEMYKRFDLLTNEINVHQQVGVTTYYLRSANAGFLDEISNDIYVEKSEENPFKDDIIKVKQVFDYMGVELPLNDSTNAESIFTPSSDILRMTPYDPPQIISVVYKARYPKIVITDSFNPSLIKLYIPDFIMEALLAYIAARVVKGMNTSVSEGETNPALTHMKHFEFACANITALNLTADVNDKRDRFTANGWV